MANKARQALETTLKMYCLAFVVYLYTNECSLCVSERYADLTITCGTETYKMHKAIVCSQSSFFERAERFPVGKVSLK
jgi:hypothetical protein